MNQWRRNTCISTHSNGQKSLQAEVPNKRTSSNNVYGIRIDLLNPRNLTNDYSATCIMSIDKVGAITRGIISETGNQGSCQRVTWLPRYNYPGRKGAIVVADSKSSIHWKILQQKCKRSMWVASNTVWALNDKNLRNHDLDIIRYIYKNMRRLQSYLADLLPTSYCKNNSIWLLIWLRNCVRNC